MTDDPYTITEDEMPSMNHTIKCDKCGGQINPLHGYNYRLAIVHKSCPSAPETDAAGEALAALDRIDRCCEVSRGEMVINPFDEDFKTIQRALSQPAPAVPQTDAQHEALESIDALAFHASERIGRQEADKLQAKANKALSQSGQAVPEAVRQLPDSWRATAGISCPSISRDREIGANIAYTTCAEELQAALATHPADGDSPAVPRWAPSRPGAWPKGWHCPHDHGFDPELGPIGCDLEGTERGCVCLDRAAFEHEIAAAPTPDEDGE